MADERALQKAQQKTPHGIVLESRKKLSLTGVKDVGSFDEESVVIYTDYGELNIRGKKLHINKLSLSDGNVNIDGFISALIYTDNQQGGGFFSKMFR